MYLRWCYLLLVVFCLACTEQSSDKDWTVKDGYVPDKETAIKIAEVVWVRIYGENVLNKRPFKATLRPDSVWLVEGTLKPNLLGGVPYAEIQKSDGRIVRIYHTR